MYSHDKFLGSMIGGAIGDALGGEYENQENAEKDSTLFVWGGEIEESKPKYLSDDTQLSFATCESIIEQQGVNPESIAETLVSWYRKNRFTGLGSATLQSIRGMINGGYWALVGKKGEYAAGNGAAMRIAPLAFLPEELDRISIRDVCRITHHNDEAYVGALAVYLAIRGILNESLDSRDGFLQKIARELPDTNVKDRITTYSEMVRSKTVAEIAQTYGNSGYVADSVPLALFSVAKTAEKGFEAIMDEIIHAGGDTDTNASIYGQIIGAELGYTNLPKNWVGLIENMNDYIWMEPILINWKKMTDRT